MEITASQAVEILGVHRTTLRRYEQEGLLEAAQEGEQGRGRETTYYAEDVLELAKRLRGERPWYNVEDAAELLDVTPVSVRKWIRNGSLKAERANGRSLVIHEDDLRRFGYSRACKAALDSLSRGQLTEFRGQTFRPSGEDDITTMVALHDAIAKGWEELRRTEGQIELALESEQEMQEAAS